MNHATLIKYVLHLLNMTSTYSIISAIEMFSSIIRLAHIPHAFLLHFPHYLGAKGSHTGIFKIPVSKNCVASAREMHNEPCSSPQGGDAPTGCSLLHLY